MSKFTTSPITLIAIAVKCSYEKLQPNDLVQLAENLAVPAEWAIQLHINLTISQQWGKLPRYIEPSFFGNISLEERSCRLCGFYTAPPRHNWHPECWNTLSSYGADAWRTAAALKPQSCAVCLVSRAEELDHIVPIGAGGLPHYSNQQMLCRDCHLSKTATDLALIKRFKSARHQFPIWYNAYLLAEQRSPILPE